MASVVEQQTPQVVETNGQPPSGGPPVEPPKKPWWQRRWGAATIGIAGLIVGAAVGAGGAERCHKRHTYSAAGPPHIGVCALGTWLIGRVVDPLPGAIPFGNEVSR